MKKPIHIHCIGLSGVKCQQYFRYGKVNRRYMLLLTTRHQDNAGCIPQCVVVMYATVYTILHPQFTLVKTHVFLLTLNILFAQSTQNMYTICVHLPALFNYIGIFVVAQKFGIFQWFTLSKMKRDRSCDFLYKKVCKLCSLSLLFRYKYFKKFMKNRYIMYRESVHLLR